MCIAQSLCYGSSRLLIELVSLSSTFICCLLEFSSQDFLICLLQLVSDQICSDRMIFFLAIILTALHYTDPINYMKGSFAPRYYILVSGKVSLGVCTFPKTEMMALNRL